MTTQAVSTVPKLPFQRIMASAMTTMVKDILTRLVEAQSDFVPSEEDIERIKSDDDSVKIRFRVDRDDVKLPASIRLLVKSKKSLYMDVILDSFFKDLAVDEKTFSVTLQFSVSDRKEAHKVWQRITVPYSALRAIGVGSNNLDLVPYFEDELSETSEKVNGKG